MNRMRIAILAWAAGACLFDAGAARAQAVAGAAEIVLLLGKGERREATGPDWIPASLKDRVTGGAYVRTLTNSQMGLLLPDRTQLRLNQNSQLQIKSMVEAAQWTETALRLNAGRAWSQARPRTGEGAPPGRAAPVIMETPAVTMSIRGTDWEVEVAPDGQTRLAVYSGSVSMANEQGSVEVAQGEAASAVPGRAPVKLVLQDPASRVQWVSSWRPQPVRWAGAGTGRHPAAMERIARGEYAAALAALRPLAAGDAAAALIAADLLIAEGESAQAAALLAPHAAEGAGDPGATALLAHALTRQDKLAEAAALLDRALAQRGEGTASVPLLLARGEVALIEGDAARARAAFDKVLALQADNAEAAYGLGLIESEREHVRAARVLLQQALASDRSMSKAAAELAAAETFAGNLGEAQRLLDELLAREPDNYVALTAQGLARLRAGEPRAALESFLKAGLVEPRYARAWLYSGVAFYQLNERERALEAFRKAAALDPRDPIPYFYESMVYSDALEFGASVVAAREAQRRMPNLRSLNQVASNQKGSANLGTALADLGMEEWARYYADEAYSPFWAGSHLFLADRYTGLFSKNSELYKGFLTDPTTFGAANRRSSLVPVPGHYGRADLIYQRQVFNQGALIGTANGLVIEPIPIAYYVSGDVSAGNSREDGTTANGRQLTLGLGARPRHDIGVFGFGTDAKIKADLRTSGLPDATLDQQEHRVDLGFNYKFAPDNQFWFKGGGGQQRNSVDGELVSQEAADTLNGIFTPILGTSIFTPAGTLDRFRSKIEQKDLQTRHSFRAGASQSLWSWGLERSRQERDGELVTTFGPPGPLSPVRLRVEQSYEVRATDAYLSLQHPFTEQATGQADLYRQNVRVSRNGNSAIDILPLGATLVTEDSSAKRHYDEWNPRFGLKWQPTPAEAVRAVAQRWRRPASSGTLAPIDTLGISLNDQLPTAGGLYKRARLQYDVEAGDRAFFQAFADREHVNNGLGGIRNAITNFEVTQLVGLRNRTEIFAPKPDIEETPVFIEGRVRTYGAAGNYFLTRTHTVSARYLRRDSRQEGVNDGQRVPYIPKNYLLLGSQWELPSRWILGASAAYRSQRYRDDVNLDPIRSGWAFGFSSYWESADKRSILQASLDNLLTRASAGVLPDTRLMLRYSYRF